MRSHGKKEKGKLILKSSKAPTSPTGAADDSCFPREIAMVHSKIIT